MKNLKLLNGNYPDRTRAKNKLSNSSRIEIGLMWLLGPKFGHKDKIELY
jgi:hypothetical protein